MPQDLISHLFGSDDSVLIYRMAKGVNRKESEWSAKYKKKINDLTESILKNAKKTGRLDLSDVTFEDLVMEHKLDITKIATRDAKNTPAKSALSTVRFSILKRIREQYDLWRKKGKMPKREKAIADNLKKEYLKRIQAAYKKYGEEFRSGEVYTQDEAVQKIKKSAGVTWARAKTIVNTETTRYYNQARKEFYDDAEGVTHYLFMAIRDSRTTKWCKTRHRLVYKKDSLILDKETPPCHWNCRSEILPLTPSNPRHKSYIQDKGSLRENNSPEPLPKGWKK